MSGEHGIGSGTPGISPGPQDAYPPAQVALMVTWSGTLGLGDGAVALPISAFVTLGFEHSVANMYLIPVAMLAGAEGVGVAGLVGNLVPVTLGNIVGGGVLVALVYWLVYLYGQMEVR